MAQRKIIDDYPAYTIYEGKSYYADGDVIAVARDTASHGKLYTMYTLGSVVGFSIESGLCPFEQFEAAKEKGHKLYWANQNSVSITAHREAKKYYFEAKIGETIRFHGKDFEIVKSWNNNIELKEI